MSEYGKTFDPNILIGHCDLISRISDFALYLDTQLVYFHTSSRSCVSVTRPVDLFRFTVLIAYIKEEINILHKLTFEPRHEKTNVVFEQVLAQTELYKHRRWLAA